MIFQTSEVNNTNSPSFQLKSPSLMPRSFGALQKSTLNSITSVDGQSSSVQSNLMLPEGSFFTSRRAADDFDRTINDTNFMDDCFGFGDDDDDVDNNNDDTLVDQSKPKKETLTEIRARLKRFLHNPDDAIKKTKTIERPAKKRAVQKTPIKSPAKTAANRTPIKLNVVFADTGAKQKDIRTAFTDKMQQNEKRAKTGNNVNRSDESITLFEEVVPVCWNLSVFFSLNVLTE